MEQRWKCTVCGLVRSSEDRPLCCPLCGADGVHFILPEQERFNLLRDLPATFRLHPVSAHFPIVLTPTVVLLLLADRGGCLETASSFLLVLLLIVLPVTVLSGHRAWKKHYRGAGSAIFKKKIGLAAVLVCLVLATVGIRFGRPGLPAETGLGRWFYLGLLLAMLPVVVLLGHYGGKLAFQWRNKKG